MRDGQPSRNVADLMDALVRAQVVSPGGAEAALTRWRAEAADPADLSQFTRWLIGRGGATEYQLALLMHGHADRLVLGPYRLLDRLAKGRLAVVFKALDPQDRPVALKVLPPSRARDAQTLARFQRESELACRLRHPNLVLAHEAGVAGPVHYLVLEYLDGQTLEALLAQRRLSPTEAVDLGRQVCEGLQYLLEQGLVHRNLEPANLMLLGASSPQVKILDISLSRSVLEEVPAGEPKPSRLTFEGQLLGVPDYLAPEQAQDAHTCDIRADLYSVGCILYHSLAGSPPFPDPRPLGTILRHASESPRPLTDIPPPLWRVLERLLAKAPAQRFATPREAADALLASLAAPPPPPPPPSPPPAAEPVAMPFTFPVADTTPEPPVRPAGRRDYFLLLVGGVGVVLAALLGWLLAHLVVALEAAPK